MKVGFLEDGAVRGYGVLQALRPALVVLDADNPRGAGRPEQCRIARPVLEDGLLREIQLSQKVDGRIRVPGNRPTGAIDGTAGADRLEVAVGEPQDVRRPERPAPVFWADGSKRQPGTRVTKQCSYAPRHVVVSDR